MASGVPSGPTSWAELWTAVAVPLRVAVDDGDAVPGGDLGDRPALGPSAGSASRRRPSPMA